ncbi:unnamed protein product [Adineta ricciae]|nr:unnamed protein product [Adineta ricciae]
MSPSTFDRYNNDTIKPNLQRILSIRIPNYFLYHNQTFPFTQATFLRSLIIEHIESKYLEHLLNQLIPLSHLSSLSIATIDAVKDLAPIYQQTFRLPSLRYCKLSLKHVMTWKHLVDSIPACRHNESDSIEHLIIDDDISCSQLDNLLSYVPRLRHLSIKLFDNHDPLPNSGSCHLLANLTVLSLEFYLNVAFETLEYIFINNFPSVEVLHISGDDESVDANRWQQIISTHLLKLRIFDARFDSHLDFPAERVAYDEKIKFFQSPFWIEHQWFFRIQFHKKSYIYGRILFSTDPYR